MKTTFYMFLMCIIFYSDCSVWTMTIIISKIFLSEPWCQVYSRASLKRSTRSWFLSCIGRQYLLTTNKFISTDSYTFAILMFYIWTVLVIVIDFLNKNISQTNNINKGEAVGSAGLPRTTTSIYKVIGEWKSSLNTCLSINDNYYSKCKYFHWFMGALTSVTHIPHKYNNCLHFIFIRYRTFCVNTKVTQVIVSTKSF